MSKIPTAEAFLIQACRDAGFTEDYARMIFKINPDSSSTYVEAMKEHTKFHVKAALETANKNVLQAFRDKEHWPDEESILNAYPESKIV